MIYFDNSATTKPYEDVLNTFLIVAKQYYGNPSSLHSLGSEAERILIKARETVADALFVEPKNIVFTSGGTEGNNLAIKGVAKQYKKRGKHVITSMIEHAATYEVFQQLEEEGYEVTYLPVNEEGRISLDELERTLREETILVSLIHVNSETGVIQPIEQIGQMLKSYPKVLFHVDNVQGVSKVPLHLKSGLIDLCTVSGHKLHGLKGSGALFIRSGVKIASLFQGGEQEERVRPGTENVAGIASFAKAIRLSIEKEKQGVEKLRTIRHYLYEQLQEIDGVQLNSGIKNFAPHILNFSIPGLKAEVLIQALSKKGIYVSTKSACSSKLASPSRILKAIGYDDERALSAIRVSLSFHNTLEEAEIFVDALKELVPELLEVMR